MTDAPKSKGPSGDKSGCWGDAVQNDPQKPEELCADGILVCCKEVDLELAA